MNKIIFKNQDALKMHLPFEFNEFKFSNMGKPENKTHVILSYLDKSCIIIILDDVVLIKDYDLSYCVVSRHLMAQEADEMVKFTEQISKENLKHSYYPVKSGGFILTKQNNDFVYLTDIPSQMEKENECEDCTFLKLALAIEFKCGELMREPSRHDDRI